MSYQSFVIDLSRYALIDNIIMVILFFSFETVEIAYTDTVDPTHHILLSEKSQGVYEVVKDGVKLQMFLNHIGSIKDGQMLEQSSNLLLQSPVLVCLTAKSKKITQAVLQLISPTFERHLLYIRIDKNQFKDLPFNRSVLINNQICYGQGFPQLRPKQQLRLAVFSLFSQQISNLECIFVEKNANELKELQKEGFSNVLVQFSQELLQNALKIASQAHKQALLTQNSQSLTKQLQQFSFAESYLHNVFSIHKESTFKEIVSFDLGKLSINGLIDGLFRESTYYNITPKSWAPHRGSKETSAYVFHNASNMHLYLAKASKLKQFTNEEEYEAKILAYYLSMVIDPSAYAVPQDKLTSLMKFSKIKSYQNKRAFFNVRPYIEGLSNLEQLGLSSKEILEIFQNGSYRGKQIKGLGGFLLTSLIINDSFNVKTLCQQASFLSVNGTDGNVKLIGAQQLNISHQIHICRTDFYSVLGLSDYKELNDSFALSNKNGKITLALKEIDIHILKQMKHHLYSITDQKLQIIKSLIIYYRWNTKLVNYYEVLVHRLKLLHEALKQVHIIPALYNQNLLDDFPQLACLLLKENYDYFLVPSTNIYSPIEYNYQMGVSAPKQTQNPYAAYIHKTCSFAIHHISFPILTFLQWVKSTNKYQIIEYMSMISHSFEDYVVMDKRLKLQASNEKKNAILVLDHAELCESLINRPKSIKTVMIFRLKKMAQIEDVGVISSDVSRKESFRQSDDELINVLLRQGSKKYSQDNQFYLIDWVFRTYLKIKCHLYSLDYKTALKFAEIVHRALSTNCHRQKEIKQNYPSLYVYLYVLPIAKDNQKIVFNYRLFEYFHMYQLFDSILSNRWSYRLQTYQNSSVSHWKHLVSGQLAIKICSSLFDCLSMIQKLESQAFLGSEPYNDCLQLIRTISEPRKEEPDELLSTLYYRVFADHVNVKNYCKIKDIQSNGNYLAIEDTQSIDIASLQANEFSSIPSTPNQSIICFCFQQDRYLYILKMNNEDVILEKGVIAQQMGLSCTVQETSIVNYAPLQDFIKLEAKFYMKIIKNMLLIVGQQIDRIHLFVLQMKQSQLLYSKQHLFNQQILNVRIVDSNSEPYLICLTSDSLYSIGFKGLPDETPSLLKKLPTKITNKTNSFFSDHGRSDTQFFLHQNNSLQITFISSGQVIKAKRFELPKPIKALTQWRDFLFVFHEGEDSLFIYKIKEDSLQREWRYFWVESNCTKLFVKANSLSIVGGSYLKRIRVRNMELMSFLTSE